MSSTVTVSRKETGLAYLFLVLLGALGAHKFYLGRTVVGFVYLFTLGILGLGVLWDLFTLPGQVRRRNVEMHAGY